MQTTPRIRVLLIEASPADAELFKIQLKQDRPGEYSIKVADSLADGLELLEAHSIDVLVVDLNLPDNFGIDICHKLQRAAPSIPIVVLTGLNDVERALEAIRIGVQDYLIKGEVDGNLLSRVIRYAIERQRVTAAQPVVDQPDEE